MKTLEIRTDGTAFGTHVILNGKKLGGLKRLELIMNADEPLSTINLAPHPDYKEKWEKELEGNDGAKLVWTVEENTSALTKINICN
jgi:hypothetical protein